MRLKLTCCLPLWLSLGRSVGGGPGVEPRKRLVRLLQPTRRYDVGRHAVQRVDVLQPRVAQQAQPGQAEHGVEHVHPVAWPVRDAAVLLVLCVSIMSI